MGTTRRYVATMNTMSFHMKEAVWLAATRDQMGLGFEKIFAHQTTIGQTCSCKHRPPIDHHKDQHFHGCHYGHAFRSMAHTKIQGVIRGLARDAGMINQNTNITAPTSTNAKYMDVAIQDPDTAVTLHINIRRSCSLAKTYQDHNNDIEARPHTFRCQTTMKANTYAKESARLNALLTTFCVDSNGSFCPRDVEHAPNGLDPTKIINLFKNGQTGSQHGKISMSVEEGILRLLANRAADPERGCGAFDVTLPIKLAAARFMRRRSRLLTML
jgi:hypothetical protein